MTPRHRAVLERLESDGAALAPVADLIPDGLRASFDQECEMLRMALHDSAGIFLPASYQAVFQAALSSELLQMVGSYLGQSPALTGVHARRDDGETVPEDLRCWHLDAEDERMIRIIVYLHDVAIDNGPFEFVPRALSGKCGELRRQGFGDPTSNPDYRAIGDDRMEAAVPRADWVACPGERLMAAVADPASVFHRTKPHRRQRRTLTLSYTSRQPRFPRLVRTPGSLPFLTAREREFLYVPAREHGLVLAGPAGS